MNNKMFVSADLETLGKWSDSVILSLGLTFGHYDKEKAETFQDFKDKGLYIEFDVEEQVKMGRVIYSDVLDWWAGNAPCKEAKEVLRFDTPKVSIRELPNLVKSYYKENGLDPMKMDVYDRTGFDWTKIQHLCEVSLDNAPLFWSYQDVIEITTALKFLGYDRYGNVRPDEFPGLIYHHAMDDAALDAYRIQKCLIEVGVI
jgi:hypothetical protein